MKAAPAALAAEAAFILYAAKSAGTAPQPAKKDSPCRGCLHKCSLEF